MFVNATALALALTTFLSPVVPTAAPAYYYYWSGDVSGINTIDSTYDFYLSDFDRYDFDITADGSGSNTLTVKIQVQLNDGSWSDVVVRHLTPGQRRTGMFTVANNTPGDECYRIRWSRKLFTPRIDYTTSLIQQP